MKTIELKSRGTEVKILQTYLRIDADGIFGAKTAAAVNAWKEENKLEANSKFETLDWQILSQILPTIQYGTKSVEVKMWQLFLGVDADGIFGMHTKASTRAYQSTMGLTVDGIVGKNTWKAAFTSSNSFSNTTTTTFINKRPVDYKQYDSKWGSVIYTKNNTYNKNQTIKNSGCGPTAMADIVATWWDSSVTPKTLAALSVANGYRTDNSGTAWGFFKYCAQKYGASKFVQTTSLATLQAALQEGAYAVVSFGPSKWTNGG